MGRANLKPDLLIIDDMGMKQLPKRSGEYLFEIIMRRHEVRSTMMTSNRPLEDWGKLVGDVPSATAILDRFLQLRNRGDWQELSATEQTEPAADVEQHPQNRPQYAETRRKDRQNRQRRKPPKKASPPTLANRGADRGLFTTRPVINAR
jgi:hypothetical protein